MDRRTQTIFDLAEEAARQQQKAQPAAGAHKLKPARKGSGKTSRRTLARPKRKQARKR